MNNTIYISNKHRFVFSHVPYSGIVFGKSFAKKHNTRQLDNLNDVNPMEYLDFFKFMYIRNPWIRVVSAFVESNIRQRKDKQLFKTWATDLLNGDKLYDVIQPQTELVNYMEESVGLDYVPRSEALVNHSIALNDIANISPTDVRIQHNPYHFKEYYNEDSEIIDLVGEQFSEDCEFFGYEYSSTTSNSSNLCKTKYFDSVFAKTHYYRAKNIWKENLDEYSRKIDNLISFSETISPEQVKTYEESSMMIQFLQKGRNYVEKTEHMRSELLSYYSVDGFSVDDKLYENCEIDKVYYITLDKSDELQKENILKLSARLDSKFQVFDAIDTRGEFKTKYLDYGLNLKPCALDYVWNFSSSFGAVGCYLSHWLIYKDVVENGYERVLILEQDANPDDVLNFFKKPTRFPKDLEFIQLNQRMLSLPNPALGYCENSVDGTESYVITNSGANKLLRATEDFSSFDSANYTDFLKWKAYDSNQHMFDTFFFMKIFDDSVQTKNCIRAPIDRFIGLNCSHNLPFSHSLNSFALPLISLVGNPEDSDVLSSRPHWEMQSFEIKNFDRMCDSYAWWDKLNETD